MRLLIKNGHLLDPVAGRDGKYDILLLDEKIHKVEKSIEEEADKVIDAEGKYVMPGFIDLHVHLREPGYEYKETIKTGSLAAARGGFTTICPMPNTKPAIDSPEQIAWLLHKAEEDSVVHICPIGAVTKGQEGSLLCSITAMAEKGMMAISEDGKSVMDTRIYREAMREAVKAGIPVFAHCEDRLLVGNGVMNEGIRAQALGMEGISNAVEDVIAARDIIMAKEAGARLHLCHCSTRDSVELVRLAKSWGQDVTAEVCPHHFTLSEDDIPGDDSNYKMNPPLRSRKDVEALKDGLRSNVMDVIATDHAPHSLEEKEKSMMEAPFGIVGLETAFALTVTELVKTGYLTPIQMVEKLSVNPAGILGIDKGCLAVGKTADLVIADMEKEYVIDKSTFVSKGKNTPFHGKKVKGRIETTIVSGKIVYSI